MDEKKLFSKVFLWMFIGLIVSFGVGYYTSINENMIYNIFSTGLYYLIFIIELALIIFLSARINKLNSITAKILFLTYAVLTGLTFGIVFLAYEVSSIILIFAITAIIFGLFSLFGYLTKIDLTKFSTVVFMSLMALIIATIINMFLGSDTLTIVLSYVGILIFMGITAYDMKVIKRMYENNLVAENLPIYGALQLYIDFINIFLRLLTLFGRGKK